MSIRRRTEKLDAQLSAGVHLSRGEPMLTPDPTQRPKRQPVPLELGGKWVAWSSDGLRIIAHGETLDECETAAEQTGEAEPSFERTPRSDARFVGFGR